MATVGIDDLASRGLRHRIDREVPPAQVIFERHVGSELRREPSISESDFAFDTGERVFLVCFRVQEYGEFAPDGLEAVTLEFLGRRTDHDPVALVNRTPE